MLPPSALRNHLSRESKRDARRRIFSWYVVGQNVCDSCHIKTNKTNISKHILKMFKLTLYTVLFLGDKNQHSPSMSNPPASRSKHSLQISWINSFHLTRDIVHKGACFVTLGPWWLCESASLLDVTSVLCTVRVYALSVQVNPSDIFTVRMRTKVSNAKPSARPRGVPPLR